MYNNFIIKKYILLTVYIVYQVEANASTNTINKTNVIMDTWWMFRKIIYNKTIETVPTTIQYKTSLIWKKIILTVNTQIIII